MTADNTPPVHRLIARGCRQGDYVYVDVWTTIDPDGVERAIERPDIPCPACDQELQP